MKASKAAESPKTSGSRKLSSAQSSWRLFCSGVPVMSSRHLVLYSRTICDSTEFSFLMRWASSIMRYSQGSLVSAAFSLIATSSTL